ncbi:MAG: hypothetical protein AAF517_02120, partial [Planctomycetota bacterium]
MLRRSLLTLCLCAILSSLSAEDGGIESRFCRGLDDCLDDSFRVTFDSGSSTYTGNVERGETVRAAVEIETISAIYGWSYGVWHDASKLELLPDRLTTEDTALDPDYRLGPRVVPSFERTSIVENGFVSSAILAPPLRVILSLGARIPVARATYRVKENAACSALELVDRLPGDEEVRLRLNETSSPRKLVHAVLSDQGCQEICSDGVDNDGDGDIDCADSQCASFFACGDEVCDDLIDNDADGHTDCGDSDCDADPYCANARPEFCGDRQDNDRDGLVDCEDLDCTMSPFCIGGEICDDGIDN